MYTAVYIVRAVTGRVRGTAAVKRSERGRVWWWWCISARLCVVSAIVVRRRSGRVATAVADTNARRPELSALPMYIPLRLYPRRPAHIYRIHI